MLLGFAAGGLAHLKEFVPVRDRPGEFLLDQRCAPGRDEQSVLAMGDEVSASGAGGAEHGYAACHGLEDHEPEAFGDRGQRDQVTPLEVSRQLEVGEPALDLDVDGLEPAQEVTVDGGTGVENQLGRVLRKSSQRPE